MRIKEADETEAKDLRRREITFVESEIGSEEKRVEPLQILIHLFSPAYISFHLRSPIPAPRLLFSRHLLFSFSPLLCLIRGGVRIKISGSNFKLPYLPFCFSLNHSLATCPNFVLPSLLRGHLRNTERNKIQNNFSSSVLIMKYTNLKIKIKIDD